MTVKAEQDGRALAAAVRRACVQTAVAGYEQARMDGLCHEGAWETAVSAMQALNLDVLLAENGWADGPTKRDKDDGRKTDYRKR